MSPKLSRVLPVLFLWSRWLPRDLQPTKPGMIGGTDSVCGSRGVDLKRMRSHNTQIIWGRDVDVARTLFYLELARRGRRFNRRACSTMRPAVYPYSSLRHSVYFPPRALPLSRGSCVLCSHSLSRSHPPLFSLTLLSISGFGSSRAISSVIRWVYDLTISPHRLWQLPPT